MLCTELKCYSIKCLSVLSLSLYKFTVEYQRLCTRRRGNQSYAQLNHTHILYIIVDCLKARTLSYTLLIRQNTRFVTTISRSLQSALHFTTNTRTNRPRLCTNTSMWQVHCTSCLSLWAQIEQSLLPTDHRQIAKNRINFSHFKKKLLILKLYFLQAKIFCI